VSKTAKTHTATALVSVTDKEGLTELALALRDAGLAIIASSGTKTFLEEKGVEVREISDYTKSPEILGGRVKTLHPKIHGGILADRDNAEHVRTLEDQATQRRRGRGDEAGQPEPPMSGVGVRPGLRP